MKSSSLISAIIQSHVVDGDGIRINNLYLVPLKRHKKSIGGNVRKGPSTWKTIVGTTVVLPLMPDDATIHFCILKSYWIVILWSLSSCKSCNCNLQWPDSNFIPLGISKVRIFELELHHQTKHRKWARMSKIWGFSTRKNFRIPLLHFNLFSTRSEWNGLRRNTIIF